MTKIKKHIKNIKNLAAKIDSTIKIMEVCGTHTMAIAKSGIRNILPDNIKLFSGPGCPVCVTPIEYVDKAIELAQNQNNIICTFGDMLKVPGTNSSLLKERARGANIKIVLNPMKSIEVAKNNPDQSIVFLSVGFETTTPTIAATLLSAKANNLKNFKIIAGNKLVEPALKIILEDKDLKINSFLLPGHVSTIIGVNAYGFMKNYNRPSVVAGFEPEQIIIAIEKILTMIINKENNILNYYPGWVNNSGNISANKIVEKVFVKKDSKWRGIGILPASGLTPNQNFKEFNIDFDISDKIIKTNGCICGEIIKGKKTPKQCPLFKKLCTPETAFGPCMVSSEGTCAAYYKYDNN